MQFWRGSFAPPRLLRPGAPAPSAPRYAVAAAAAAAAAAAPIDKYSRC